MINLETLVTDTNAAAEYAYARAARGINGYWTADEIHFQPACMSVSQFLCERLAQKGYDLVQVGRTGCFYRDYDGNGDPVPGTSSNSGYHKYLRVRKTQPPVLIDPTWQQFLEPEMRDDSLPKVLVGTSQEIVSTLRKLGLSQPGMLEMWVPDPYKEFHHIAEDFVPANRQPAHA